MKKILFFTMLFIVSQTVFALEKTNKKITIILDWFVNPNHAALVVAKQKGYFKKYGLTVDIIEPADPSMPPKLVAAGKFDMAVDYQPQFHMRASEGLPLMRIGTLISTPLNSLIVLKKSKINSIADLKGKTIGYSVNGFEQNLLTAMLASANLTPKDVKWINVNWALSPSLMSGKVDAVFGAYRNFELNQMQIENHPGRAFYPEEHGVPPYDELVLIIHKDKISEKKFTAFLSALEQATVFIMNHPDAAWEIFKNYKPKELDNETNRLAWQDTLPRLALRPNALDNNRYDRMARFLQKIGIIENIIPVSNYAIELPVD